MSRLSITLALVLSCFCSSHSHAQKDESHQQIVRAMLIAVKDNDAGVRKAAFVTLAKTAKGTMEVVAALQMGLNDTDQEVQMAALMAFLKVVNNADEKARVLIDLLDDDTGPLVDEFGDEIPGVSKIARRHLKKLGAPAVPQLIAALKNKDKRTNVLRVLKQIGPEAKESAPAIVELLKDEDAETRKVALNALAQLGGEAKKVVPKLTEMLDDDNGDVRRSAITCLSKYGSEAKDAVPKLMELLNDEDPLVRKKTVNCLGAIARQSSRPAGIDPDVWKYARRMFREMDSDKDGQIEATEARNYEISMKHYDFDKDGVLTIEEFAKGMTKEWAELEAPFSRILDLFRPELP